MRIATSAIHFAVVCASLSVVACGSSGTNAVEDSGIDAGGDDAVTDAAPNDAPADAPTDGGGDAASDGLCTITKGTSGLLVRGTLLLPTGDPAPGEVALDAAGKITCVGTCAASAASATIVDCSAGGVISPGLINAHDHTDYNIGSPYKFDTTRWSWRNGWRTGALSEKALPKMPTTKTDAESAVTELRHLFGGTTSVLGSGGIDGLVRNVAKYPAFSDTADLPGKTAYFDTFPMKDQDGHVTSPTCAPASVQTAAKAFVSGTYVPHVAEGIAVEAHNEFACMLQTTVGLVTAHTSMIHTVGFAANDADATVKAGAMIIWSPRSNIELYGNTAPISLYKTMGVTMAIGTDWLPSGSMNLLRELACADSLNQKYFGKVLSDRDLFDMATKNGARAAGYEAVVGQLAVGMVGDITIFDGRTNKGFRAVLDAGAEDVRLVLRGGKVLYGDAPLVSALGSKCDAVSVCGIDRQVCMDAKTTAGAVTFASAQASVTGGGQRRAELRALSRRLPVGHFSKRSRW
jgi:large repetitive protein